MCAVDKAWITELTLIHKNIMSVRNLHAQVYRSIWCKIYYDVTDKHNNISSEGLDRHYHKNSSSSYQTHWDISDNVCLNLQNCCYSTCIYISELLWENILILLFWNVVTDSLEKIPFFCMFVVDLHSGFFSQNKYIFLRCVLLKINTLLK